MAYEIAYLVAQITSGGGNGYTAPFMLEKGATLKSRLNGQVSRTLSASEPLLHTTILAKTEVELFPLEGSRGSRFRSTHSDRWM